MPASSAATDANGDLTVAADTGDLTVAAVAAELGSTKRHVYRLIERRHLAAIKYGKQFIRVSRAELDAFKATYTIPAQDTELLDADTRAFLRELAAAATALTAEQRATISAVFQGGRDDA